ncbi:MAG: hypothetical protein ABIR57_09410, partial [Aeromicrobium sp.]
MAIGLDRLRESQPWTARDLRRWIVPLSIVTVVALRLPFLTHAPTPDEAGFLLVGGQWHPGGSSLYGNYWVDRPPLLIGIFQIASALGGLPALRLIGCLAAAATVGGSSLAAGLVAGKRASRWAAIAAAALCTTPLLGTVAVNGELLAGPFVVAGIAAAIGALKTDDEGRARLFGIAAGAAAISAMMIKQNFADVFVFGLVATVVAWHRRDIGTARFFRVLSSAIAGAALALFALAVFTLAQGTSLSGVYDAMYPFRFEADRVIAAGGSQYATARLFTMLLAAAASGIVLLFAAAGWGIAAKRLYGAAAWGL